MKTMIKCVDDNDNECERRKNPMNEQWKEEERKDEVSEVF
jgi:hypothetical protein